MKKIAINELANINGGFSFSGFCKGFAGVELIYAAGVIGNLWNPVGAGTAAAALLVDGACWIGGGFS